MPCSVLLALHPHLHLHLRCAQSGEQGPEPERAALADQQSSLVRAGLADGHHGGERAVDRRG